jgi:hypothetical protein
MFLSLMIAAAAPASAIDAEREFAAEAQKSGQWTAFRKWSTEDSVMFDPQPKKTHDMLKGVADPPVPVFWWPGHSYVSCDGAYAVNTGPWVRQFGKLVGYFTTVWQRQPDGAWKWTLDHGDVLERPRSEGGDIKPRQASCGGKPTGAQLLGTVAAAGYRNGGGRSADGTLVWSWTVDPNGARHFLAQLWTGNKFETVVDDQVKGE